MPIIKSISVGKCVTTETGLVDGRVVTYITDSAGDGLLDYTTNNGVIPANVKDNFEVYLQGNRLKWPDEFTVSEFGVDTVTSRITIQFPIPPPATYTIIAYY